MCVCRGGGSCDNGEVPASTITLTGANVNSLPIILVRSKAKSSN